MIAGRHRASAIAVYFLTICLARGSPPASQWWRDRSRVGECPSGKIFLLPSFFCPLPSSLNIHPLNPVHCFVAFLASCFTLGIVFQRVFRVASSKRDCRDI